MEGYHQPLAPKTVMTMKSDEYWQKRMETLNEAELNKGEEYIKQQQVEYEKSLARIRQETESWYARLAKNNDVSMAEARKLLSAKELKEFHWTVEEYIERGRENAIDQRWMKQLENASAKVHISRLEEIELKTRQELELLAARRVKGTTDVLGDIYKDGYYKGIYEVQRGIGQGLPFAKLDVRQIDKVLAKPWAPDGRNFSARIWGDRDKLVAELQTSLTQDLIRGGNVEKVISDFSHRMNVSRHAAERLIRTEAAYFSGQSRLDGYKETGVKHYKYVATMDARTSDQCRDMEGKIIPLSEAKAGVNYPPLHAYCRSTTIPHYSESESEEEAVYDVQEDLTYKEWLKQHAPNDATEPPVVDEPAPVTPPAVTQVERPRLPTEPRHPDVRAKDKVFSSTNEADDWIDESTSDWVKQLTPADIKTFRRYSGDDYEDLNEELRNNLPSPDTIEFARALKRATDKFVLAEPIVTWRGSDNYFGTNKPEDLIGTVKEELSFFSTSLLRDRAFTEKELLFEVHLPAGAHGAPIKYFSEYPDEFEFLLSPILKYVIIDATILEDGKLKLVIEVINDEE